MDQQARLVKRLFFSESKDISIIRITQTEEVDSKGLLYLCDISRGSNLIDAFVPFNRWMAGWLVLVVDCVFWLKGVREMEWVWMSSYINPFR